MPANESKWILTGASTLVGVFSRVGFPSDWRPQRDLDPRGTVFAREFRAA